MDINPDLVDGVVVYNILDENFVKQYIKAVCYVRYYLSCKGDQVGPLKTCGFDPHDPVLKLTLQADATANLETHLLIYKGDANSYWFFAGGGWRQCSDVNDTSVRLLGPVDEANFNSKMEGFAVKEIGPGSFYEALQGLASENGNREDHFRLLSFMFLDAARFNTVLDFVVKTFEAATDRKTHKQRVDDVVAKCPGHWKRISNTIHKLFPHFSLEKSSCWEMPHSVVCDLELPTYDPSVIFMLQSERVTVDEVAACLTMIHVLCPACLIVN